MLDEIRHSLEQALLPLKLKPRPVEPTLFMMGADLQRQIAPSRVEGAWAKKTPFMNRGLALVVVDQPGTLPGQVVAAHKDQIGEKLGLLPFLYPMALHMVLVGPGLDTNPQLLEGLTDKVNTFTTNLMTLHVADTVSKRVSSAKSWNAFFSKKIQEAVDGTLREALQRV
jgi:hypothetical protein